MTLDSTLITALIVAAVALVTLVLTTAWLIRKHLKLKRDYEDIAEIVHGLNNDFREIYNNAAGADERLIALELQVDEFGHQLQELIVKMNDLQNNASASHPYGQAIQQVRSGASVQDLMQTSGLSLDEATLLVRLHGSQSR